MCKYSTAPHVMFVIKEAGYLALADRSQTKGKSLVRLWSTYEYRSVDILDIYSWFTFPYACEDDIAHYVLVILVA